MSPSASAGPSRQNQSLLPTRRRMPSLFNTIRAAVYGTVLLFTIICLAMAGHFQTVLAASDLTRFVPFAIFVCSASFFIILVLLVFSLILKERNPISTRIEIASLGLAGIFWLVLGVYLTTSESQDADVECFASADDTEPLDDSVASFHTDQYQAMYRVLMTFALINAVLVLASCLTLLFLAIRKHRQGDEHMWYGPVTACAWLNNYGGNKPSSRNKAAILPTAAEKPERQQSRRQHPYGNQNAGRQYTEKPPRPYPKPYQAAATRPSRQDSKNSKSSGNSSLIPSHTSDFENGGMLNPYRNATAGRR
ncbi:hypothetical protein BDQ17DRAFT_1398153 [Cyathus striatus]|nr:hypothetical protein BDQ17DRAFT_1440871 [Cyathus striatus]KAF9009055.1 hypothetical protein BDQ17DRAFT_1398153 [Cyathus striatus]